MKRRVTPLGEKRRKGKEKETESGEEDGPSPRQRQKLTDSSRGCGKRFRIGASNFFLTYPQCPMKKEEALSLLTAKVKSLSDATLLDYLIAEEKHKDGTPHLHAYLKLSAKVTVNDPQCFNLEGSNGITYHGNYQGARNPQRVLTYCAKEGDYLASPAMEELLTKRKKTTWADALSAAREEGAQAAMSILESGGERATRDLLLNYDRLTATFRSLQPTKPHSCARPLEDFLLSWEWDRSKLLLLYGPTNAGKTTLACSLLPHGLLTSHLDKLAEAKKHEGVIFDDMSFQHLHREAQLALVDTAFDRQVHIRYRVAELPAGFPRILTTNREPFEVLLIYDPAIARRVQVIWMGGVGGYKEGI